jgi:hypothetical protein
MKEEKDAYDKLPQTVRDQAELHFGQQGMKPEQVRAQYIAAQAKVNPGPSVWNRNLFKRKRRKGT